MNSFVPSAAWTPGASWPHVGVDVVSVARIDKAGEAAVRRLVCGGRELAALEVYLRRRPAGNSLLLTAATWAVKEAAVKAAGGRPPGFGWPMVSVEHYGSAPGRLGAFLGEAVRQATGRQATGSRAGGWCRYQWRQSVPTASGLGAWAAADGSVWAIVLESVPDMVRCDDGKGGWD